jgi:YbgC/YbaW family acyl-CoA thioester hydrolase
MIARAVRGDSCPEVGPCETPFRVLPADLDFLLHMNNAVYFQVMDIARGDWLVRSKVWQRLRKKKLHLVVSDETIQFRKSLMLGQKFTIETRVVGWDEKAFFVEQRFVRNGELWANALLRLRALDASHKPVPTSEVLPVLGAGHVPSPPLPDWVTSWMQTQGALRTTMRPVRAA